MAVWIMQLNRSKPIKTHTEFNDRRKELESSGYVCIELDESIRYAKYKKGRRIIVLSGLLVA